VRVDAVERAAVLSSVDGLGVARSVQVRVAQVSVELVDDRRTHVNELESTDADSTAADAVAAAAGCHVEQVQYRHRRQTLHRNAHIHSFIHRSFISGIKAH